MFWLSWDCASQKASAAENAGARPVSAIKTSYYQIAEHLDLGGNAYFYLSTEHFLTGVSDKISSLREFVTNVRGLPPGDRALANQGFDIATRLVKNCGVEQISGVGMSSVKAAEGLYRNKFMIHHYPGNNEGYLWSVMGEKPHAFPGIDFLPANTAYATFSDFKAGQLWQIIRSELARSGIPEALEFLEEFPEALEQETGLSLDQILQSLDDEFGFVITLDPNKKMALPLPSPTPIEIPEPGLMLIIKVNDSVLFDKIDETLTLTNPEVVKVDESGLKMSSMKLPPPIPASLTVALSGDYLFLSSSDALVREALAVKSGERPGLKSTTEFQELAGGITLEGNHFSFASERLTTAIIDMQKAVMANSGQSLGVAEAFIARAQSQRGRSLAVFANTKEGWLMDSKGSQSGGEAVLLAAVAAPAAVAAGLMLPALSQAKGRAQTIKCVSNAKQIGLAFRIYRNDNDDMHPPAKTWCDALQNVIPSQKVFVCPSHPDQRCSYAFNIALDGKPDSIPPDTVMFFEADAGWNAAGGMELIGKGDAGHPDNGGTIIVGYVDGSVHQIRRSQLGSLRWKP